MDYLLKLKTITLLIFMCVLKFRKTFKVQFYFFNLFQSHFKNMSFII